MSQTNPGRIAENILYFARLLRAAGMPVGSGQVLDAIASVDLIGIDSRQDLYWCLFSQFVTRQSQRQLFEQAFYIFWRNPHIRERLLGAMLPRLTSDGDEQMAALNRRLGDALSGPGSARETEADAGELQLDTRFTSSRREVLREQDFETMSAAEIAEAKRALARLRLPLMWVKTRRFQGSEHPGRTDMRATMRADLRSSGFMPLKFKKKKLRPPPLVVLCDISGSMSQYSRMFLHFMHAITNDRDRVHCFVFGTRLTNISRHLRQRDVDMALNKAAAAVTDWSGGTRIGDCLKQFNIKWSRRVLSQGAITLLISDGLDRGDDEQLRREMERLAKSSRRLIWLNPLLRYEGFQPRAQGIKAMLPHVDELRSAHNIRSLTELAGVLSRQRSRTDNSLSAASHAA